MVVCPGCGAYITPNIDQAGQVLRCPDCGDATAARLVPLFVVTGASGVGKTAIVPELRSLLPDFDVFETDIIWDSDLQLQRSNWLRIAFSIAQSGRGAILCGTMLPADLRKCDHYPLFSRVHFLNLHCEDATRAARLRSRLPWRGCTEEFIEQHRVFARWLLDHAATDFDPPMPSVDTSVASVAGVAGQVEHWVRSAWIAPAGAQTPPPRSAPGVGENRAGTSPWSTEQT